MQLFIIICCGPKQTTAMSTGRSFSRSKVARLFSDGPMVKKNATFVSVVHNGVLKTFTVYCQSVMFRWSIFVQCRMYEKLLREGVTLFRFEYHFSFS